MSSDLGLVTATQIALANAATEEGHAVRLAEFEALLETKGDQSDVAALLADQHVAVTKLDTDSIAITLSGQQVSASVRIASSNPLESTVNGLRVRLGTGSTDAAAGNHTHSQLHDPATAQDSNSIDMTVSSGQAISASLRLAPSSKLVVTENGVAVDSDEVALKVHSHDIATSSGAGFMSAAHVQTLEELSVEYGDTDSVQMAVSSGTLFATARVKSGGGLVSDGDGLSVDPSEVSLQGHTHPDVTGSTAGFMTPTLRAAVLEYQAMTFSNSGTVNLAKSGNDVRASVRFGLGLEEGPSGLVVDFDEVSPKTHSHDVVTSSSAGFMSPALLAALESAEALDIDDTDTIDLTKSAGTLTADVRIVSSGGIIATAAGLQVDPALVSLADHDHDDATTGAAGFMSAADKLKLDNLSALSFSASGVVILTKTGNTVFGSVNYGYGLAVNGSQLVVSSSDFAIRNHTHSNATNSTAGFMSAADKVMLGDHEDRLDAIEAFNGSTPEELISDRAETLSPSLDDQLLLLNDPSGTPVANKVTAERLVALIADMVEGPWSSGVTYTKGKIVTHSGDTYFVKQTALNVTPPNASYYARFVSDGDPAWGSITGTMSSQADLMSALNAKASLTGTETLTNKTINGANNTITNVSLTAGVTGTLPIANGGTGQTTAQAARNALLPSQTSAANKFLVSDGTNASWVTVDLGTAHVTGTLPIAKGGTGQTSANAAFNALAPSQASAANKVLVSDGTNASWVTVDLGTAHVTGTLPIAKGGTGQTTAQNALNALLPSQSTHSGKFLQTDGTNSSWVTVSTTRTGVWRDSYFDAKAMRLPTSGGATATTVAMFAGDVHDALSFANAATQSAYIKVVLPAAWDKNDIHIKLFWKSGASGSARFRISVADVGDGETYTGPFQDTASFTAATSGVNLMNIDGVTINCDTGYNAPVDTRGMLIVKVERLGADGADTLAGALELFGLNISYQESSTEPSAP